MTVSTRSSSSRARVSNIRRGPAVSKRSCTASSSQSKKVVNHQYADIAEQWLKTDDNISIINDLDKIGELREFRDPYTKSEFTAYEIPIGLFLTKFGLRYDDVASMVRSVKGSKYVYIESTRAHN